jgi:hypothetical protein
MENRMKHETFAEVTKAAPAVGGALYGAVTLNDAVLIATLAYIVLQAAYLIWKWVREARK